jgi:hypothetical protein
MGNLPAYSTTAFSTARVRPPRATLLPLVPAPGRALVSLRHRKLPPHRSMRRAASQPCRPPAGCRAARVCPTGRAPGDGQRTTTCRTRQDGWLRPRGTVSNAMAHAYDASQREGSNRAPAVSWTQRKAWHAVEGLRTRAAAGRIGEAGRPPDGQPSPVAGRGGIADLEPDDGC